MQPFLSAPFNFLHIGPEWAASLPLGFEYGLNYDCECHLPSISKKLERLTRAGERTGPMHGHQECQFFRTKKPIGMENSNPYQYFIEQALAGSEKKIARLEAKYGQTDYTTIDQVLSPTVNLSSISGALEKPSYPNSYPRGYFD
jgi:hypothetical protein